MDLENGSGTNTESVERGTVGNGCANPDRVWKPKKGRVYGVRNFPVGCGPPKRLSSENLGTLVQPSLTSSSLKHLEEEDEDEEEEDPVSPLCENIESEVESSVGLEKLESVKTSTSAHEDSSKLSETDGPVKARVYPPRRKISGIRTFPPGCGRNKAPTNEVAPVFGTSETGTRVKNEEEHKEQTMYTSNAAKSEPHSECLEIGKGSPSNKDSREESPDVKPSTENVIPEHRTIVMALMAPQNCPWTQKKRVSRPKKTNG